MISILQIFEKQDLTFSQLTKNTRNPKYFEKLFRKFNSQNRMTPEQINKRDLKKLKRTGRLK